MKFLIMFLVVIFSYFTPHTVYGQLPDFVPGEDFQRGKLIDCQTVFIPEFKNVHPEIKVTYCFYKMYYFDDGIKKETIVKVQRSGKFQLINN